MGASALQLHLHCEVVLHRHQGDVPSVGTEEGTQLLQRAVNPLAKGIFIVVGGFSMTSEKFLLASFDRTNFIKC